MKKFKKEIIDIANETKFSPSEVCAFEQAFDFIERFSFVKDKNELDQIIMESTSPNGYVYSEIPYEAKRICEKALEKNGDHGVSTFYNSYSKFTKNHLQAFIEVVAKQRKQPKDFCANGVLTYRHLKRANSIDKTCEVRVFNG